MEKITSKKDLIKELSAIMPLNEAIGEIDFLLEEEFGLSKKDLLLEPQKFDNIAREAKSVVDIRIKTRKPLQYIINKASFYNETYYVDENVLIPRPETELLVKEVISNANSSTKILDIGTGSGCIAITCAKLLKNDNVTSCDISEKAIETAKINAKKIAPERNITFIKSDLFQNINETFDIIVSNPPYISEDFKSDLQQEVIEFEPHLALFADDNGLYFYKKIIKEIKPYLNNGAIILFEVGINQADSIKDLFEADNFSQVKIIKDYNSIERIVIAHYNF